MEGPLTNQQIGGASSDFGLWPRNGTSVEVPCSDISKACQNLKGWAIRWQEPRTSGGRGESFHIETDLTRSPFANCSREPPLGRCQYSCERENGKGHGRIVPLGMERRLKLCCAELYYSICKDSKEPHRPVRTPQGPRPTAGNTAQMPELAVGEKHLE